MANDPRTIGEKLRALDEEARQSMSENRAPNREPAEGSRENVTNSGGISNRPLGEERQRQEKTPPRGKSKERGRA